MSRGRKHLIRQYWLLLVRKMYLLISMVHQIKLINDLPELEQEYGEQVPVIMIDNKIHDYWRVDIERFTKAIKS